MSASDQSSPRLASLRRFLEHDPDNLNLLADAAGAALDAGALDEAAALLDRYRAITEPPPALRNLEGLLALQDGRFADASAHFAHVLAAHPGDPSLRFNLAWAKAMLGEHDAAAALIDDSVVEAAPRAAALKVEALHHLERVEEALACGQGFAELQPENAPLLGALSAAALDADEVELARFYAERAGDDGNGLTTRASLALASNDPDAALPLFEQALSAAPTHARALLGKGLALLAKGQADAAAPLIDHGAEAFGDHIGSWIAAGWARFVLGDRDAARTRFERALALDDSFAESHGALAALDVLDGNTEAARRRIAVAVRLDRRCFAAALAQSLLAAQQGDQAAAERIRQKALTEPVGLDGKTLAETAAVLGLSRRGP